MRYELKIYKINNQERSGNIRNELDLILRIQRVANKYEMLSNVGETRNYTYFKMWTDLEQLMVEIRRDMVYRALNDILSNDL